MKMMASAAEVRKDKADSAGQMNRMKAYRQETEKLLQDKLKKMAKSK